MRIRVRIRLTKMNADPCVDPDLQHWKKSFLNHSFSFIGVRGIRDWPGARDERAHQGDNGDDGQGGGGPRHQAAQHGRHPEGSVADPF
jgi:hypothetical protein